MQLVVALVLVCLVTATLKVQAPQSLSDYFRQKYPNGQVPYSIANYGAVPYGKTLSGQIGLPSVLEDCVYEQLPDSETSKKILLVERNDCTFTQKLINVQKEGGKLAIIMDNRSQDPGSIVMVDDGRGPQVSIPTILISSEDGQQILKALQESSVIVGISFEIVVRQQGDLQIWVDITSHQNFVFLRNLRPYYSKIQSHINFSVGYPTRNCTGRSCSDSDCFYNGNYCRTDFKYFGVENKGQLIIKEQLRQFFIFQLSVDKWWNYILSFDQTCEDLSVFEECSEKLMKKYGIDSSKINKQIEDSFGQEDNTVLRKFADVKSSSSIGYYPSVVVNSMIYRGNLQAYQVYELICESLQTQPEGCAGFVAESSTLSTWIILIVVGTLAFGVFLIVCFRRIARRQISDKISSQVNELVNQYITMYENDRFNETELPTRQKA